MLNEIALNVTAAQLETALRTPELLDTFTIAEGEEPVAFYHLSLSDKGFKKILINGEIYSDDTESVKRTLFIGIAEGYRYLDATNIDFSRKNNQTNDFSIDAELMANGRMRARAVFASRQYLPGTVLENPGRKTVSVYQEIGAVHLKIINAQFAAGTSFEVWGVE